MKIYNEAKDTVLENPDLTLGRLREEQIKIGQRSSPIEEVQNADGSITTTDYGTCDIFEPCYVYVPHTPEQLREIRIQQLKAKLRATDYVVTKLAEMKVYSVAAYENEVLRYADIVVDRQAWRAEINELEEGGQA